MCGKALQFFQSKWPAQLPLSVTFAHDGNSRAVSVCQFFVSHDIDFDNSNIPFGVQLGNQISSELTQVASSGGVKSQIYHEAAAVL